MFLTWAFSLLIGVSARADCVAVDFRPQLGPVRDQADTDLCFAYTAADMVSQQVGIRISALDLASSFYLENVNRLGTDAPQAMRDYFSSERSSIRALVRRDRNDSEIKHHLPRIDWLSNGDTETTILMANVKGLCSEADFASDGGYTVADEHWLNDRQHLAAAHRESCNEWTLNTGVTSVINSPLADCVNAQWLARINRRCHRLSLMAPLFTSGYAVTDQLSVYQQKLKDPKFDRRAARQQLLANVDSSLNEGKIAGISYNGNLLWGGSMIDDSGDHASSVVARKLAAGKCYYLVRDSFGSDCSIYKDRFQGRCEAGHVWLSAHELTVEAQLYGVSHIVSSP